MTIKQARIEPIQVEETILRLLSATAPGASISPPDVARALDPSPEWHRLMTIIRRVAVDLALAGRITILRKGKPADPSDFKGVYRLGLPRQE